jgi:hypothetical protein
MESVKITENNEKESNFSSKNNLEEKLLNLEQRIKELEDKLDEKDRELREISINRAEFVQQLNMIYTMLKKARFSVGRGELVKRALGLDQESISFKKTPIENKNVNESKGYIETNDQVIQEKIDTSGDVKEVYIKPEDNKLVTVKVDDDGKDTNIVKKRPGHLDVISELEPEKLEFLGKYSYRERMILMNRIDIYRLYTTVIILSSQIRYPRALTDIEEKELREFIKELSEFENLVLDLNNEEDIIWEKGKVCEKQAIQLFNRFFNI